MTARGLQGWTECVFVCVCVCVCVCVSLQPQGSGPLTLPPLVPTSDPHLLHLRALILSNHAGLMAAQGRWKEAEVSCAQ